MKTCYLLITILFTAQLVMGQVDDPGDRPLKDYLKFGLENNLALQQKRLSYNKSLQALKEARGLFFPEISVNARYSVADGGRMIDIPVGDMMNPVYSTLNQILQEDRFSPINNEHIPFLRPTEQETKASLVQPIFNTLIWYNYQIKKGISEVESLDVDVYKRELVAEIKKAYYNYMKSLQLAALYDQTLEIVHENLRVNRSLFKNDKVTIEAIYRSEAEISGIEQKIAFAGKQVKLARSYFNFLLNRPLGHDILLSDSNARILPDKALSHYQEKALQKREEIDQMNHYMQLASNQINLNKGNYYPVLMGAVDYGFQGEAYRFTDKDDYFMASLVMRWSLFNGTRKHAKLQQAKINQQMIGFQEHELVNQISLQVIEAYYDLIAAEKAIHAAQDRFESATKAFRIIDKKYNNGQVNLLAYLDARNAMTQAGIGKIMSEYDYHALYADFERVTGIYVFDD